MLYWTGQVGRYLSDSFYLSQTFIEEVFGLFVTWSVFSSFLVGDEVNIAEGLGFYLMTVHEVTQLVHEQI